VGTEPIRILRVIARLNVGGPALHVAHLSAGLRHYGYETTLVAGRIGAGEGSMEDVARGMGVEPVFVESLHRAIDARGDVAAVAALRRLIREQRPDILHTHTAKAGAIGRAAAELSGAYRPRAVVHTFHGHVLRGYFGKATTGWFRRIETVLARRSDALVAVSPQIRDELAALGVAPPARFAVIRLGLDLDGRTATVPGTRERVRAELRIPDGSVAVAWLGRMTGIKKVHDLVTAFARASVPDATLVLVGDGPDREGLEELARELGIYDRCRFTGYRDDVAELYAAADVVALTSANEGTPVSLIEAMAAGRPVLSTDVGGVADVVDDRRTGLLVPAGDVAAIAAGLRELVEDGNLREQLASEAKPTVLDRYSVPRLLGDVDCLYRGLLGESAERPRFGPQGRPLVPVIAPATLAQAGKASRSLRIMLVSQYFGPEVGATQTRMQSFAEHLAARGHDVTVVSEFPNHPHGVIPEAYRGYWVEDDRSNPYRVLRVRVAAAAEKTQRTRMAFYLSYMAMASLVGARAGRVDVVVATTPPLFAAAAGLALARLSGAPLVLDVRDLWPAAAVSLGQLSNRAALRASLALERLLYREASRVVAVTAPFCNYIDGVRSRLPATALVPNGTLEQFFEPHGRGAREELGVADDVYLVTFAGTLGIAQALPAVFDAADELGDGFSFAFVGDGPAKDLLVAEAATRGLRNVSFHDQRPLDAIMPVLAASDALLVTLSRHPTFADFVPSKLIDFMAVGRPVVLAAAGEPARLLEWAGAGIAVPPEDPVALARAVRYLRDNPHEAEEMGSRGRCWAGTRLRNEQAARLEHVLLDAVGAARVGCGLR